MVYRQGPPSPMEFEALEKMEAAFAVVFGISRIKRGWLVFFQC